MYLLSMGRVNDVQIYSWSTLLYSTHCLMLLQSLLDLGYLAIWRRVEKSRESWKIYISNRINYSIQPSLNYLKLIQIRLLILVKISRTTLHYSNSRSTPTRNNGIKLNLCRQREPPIKHSLPNTAAEEIPKMRCQDRIQQGLDIGFRA